MTKKKGSGRMYDYDLVSGKLNRWRNYLNTHSLPTWESIPDLGLYMDQVLTLLSGYLPFLPKKTGEEQIITTAAINNYVRTKLMPPPDRKKYRRKHIAYLIMICSLKQSLSMSEIQQIIPSAMTEQDLKGAYNSFVEQYTGSVKFFVGLVEREMSQEFGLGMSEELNVNRFVFSTAVISNFSKILTMKLLDLQGCHFTPEAVADYDDEAARTALNGKQI